MVCFVFMCVQSLNKAKAGGRAEGDQEDQDGGFAAKRGDDTVSDVPAVRGCLHLRVRTRRAGTGAV